MNQPTTKSTINNTNTPSPTLMSSPAPPTMILCSPLPQCRAEPSATTITTPHQRTLCRTDSLTRAYSINPQTIKSDEIHIIPTPCPTCTDLSLITEWFARDPAARFQVVRKWKESMRQHETTDIDNDNCDISGAVLDDRNDQKHDTDHDDKNQSQTQAWVVLEEVEVDDKMRVQTTSLDADEGSSDDIDHDEVKTPESVTKKASSKRDKVRVKVIVTSPDGCESMMEDLDLEESDEEQDLGEDESEEVMLFLQPLSSSSSSSLTVRSTGNERGCVVDNILDKDDEGAFGEKSLIMRDIRQRVAMLKCRVEKIARKPPGS